MRELLYLLLFIALVYFVFGYIEGNTGCGCEFKLFDKMFGFEFKAAIREVPKEIKILR